MSRSESAVLWALARLTAAHGYVPSTRELAKAVGLSLSATHWALVKLEESGCASSKQGAARTTCITMLGWRWLKLQQSKETA
jgi:DNA-binding transcriptional regulator YhcF (GntR family)